MVTNLLDTCQLQKYDETSILVEMAMANRESKRDFEALKKVTQVVEMQEMLDNYTWSNRNELAAFIRVDFTANDSIT
jgi:hypothetical protein